MNFPRPWLPLFFCIMLFGCTTLDQITPAAQQNAWSISRHHFALQSHAQHPKIQALRDEYLKNKPHLIAMLAQSRPYYAYVLNQVIQRGMPAEIALLPFIESHYDPFAYSLAGATGIWQMMPGTGSGLGLKINWWFDGRRDIIASTDAALNYLSYLHDFFHGDWLLAIAAYDAGSGRVLQAIQYNQKKHYPIDYWSLSLPKETLRYVPKLLALASIIQHPQTAHLQLPEISMSIYFTPVTLPTSKTLKDIAKMSGISLTELRQINPGFRRWETGPNQPYTILIPSKRLETFQKALKKEQETTTYLTHTVRPGDTLSMLAQHYHTTVHVLIELNQLNDHTIKVGQKLHVPHPPKSWKKKHKKSEKYHTKIRADHLPGPQSKTYLVKAEDSMMSIAKRFHLKKRQITSWNHLDQKHRLRKGQRLQLWLVNAACPKGLHTHVVKKGEALWNIAHQAHTHVQDIMHRNHLTHAIIHPGQVLKIPCQS